MIQPAVRFETEVDPWQSSQFLPGSPHNLPATNRENAIVERYRYGEFVDGNYIVGVQSTLIIPRPAGRRNFLGLRNAGATVLYIGFDAEATVNSWCQLAAGASMALDVVAPQNDIYCASSAAGGLISYVVSNQ